jgi:hypothetical protein
MECDLTALKSKWPSAFVARKQIKEFTGGLVSSGTMANDDCLGEGPEGAFRVGRNTGYPVDSVIRWLEERLRKDKPITPKKRRSR